MKEIMRFSLTPKRLSIDPLAMVIDNGTAGWFEDARLDLVY